MGHLQTYSLIQTFFCAMAMSPEIRKKAQEELELVVGLDRLPSYEDQEDLPYIQAVYLECVRWLPVVPPRHCSPPHYRRLLQRLFHS